MHAHTTTDADATLRNLINAITNTHARRVTYDGALLRNTRITSDVSIAMVAALIGVSTFTVSLWEKGTRIPQERFVPKLERLLGVLSEPV